MMRLLIATIGVSVTLCLVPQPAQAQFMYPMGYGNYGMSKWGGDPASGYMAGLGSYARGQGVYQVDKAKADAINADTMIKWNKALRARQAVLRAEKAKDDARKAAELNAQLTQLNIQDGTTLNSILFEIFDADPALLKTSQAKGVLSTNAIKEIPFEWDSEALTLCIDQMTGKSSLPPLLMAPKYAAERDALRAAVEPAIKEDMKGDLSPATVKKIVAAVDKFRAKFSKTAELYENGYVEAQEYLTTLASLPRMLNDDSMKAFLSQIDGGQDRTIGELIAFMNAYNLRFGAASSERQVRLYSELIPVLKGIRDAVVPPATTTTSKPDRDGSDLRAAAKAAFKKMNWDQLDAHTPQK